MKTVISGYDVRLVRLYCMELLDGFLECEESAYHEAVTQNYNKLLKFLHSSFGSNPQWNRLDPAPKQPITRRAGWLRREAAGYFVAVELVSEKATDDDAGTYSVYRCVLVMAEFDTKQLIERLKAINWTKKAVNLEP